MSQLRLLSALYIGFWLGGSAGGVPDDSRKRGGGTPRGLALCVILGSNLKWLYLRNGNLTRSPRVTCYFSSLDKSYLVNKVRRE